MVPKPHDPVGSNHADEEGFLGLVFDEVTKGCKERILGEARK
jgi:hypothetical protein